MNMPQDPAFLSLLSSQRQLLNQLKMEKATRCAGDESNDFGANRFTRPFLPNRTPMCPMNLNQCSSERRNSLDMLLTGRLSSGLNAGSSDQRLLPTFPEYDGFGPPLLDAHGYSRASPGKLDAEGYSKASPGKRTKLEDFVDVPIWKKRRLSSMGLGFISDPTCDYLTKADSVPSTQIYTQTTDDPEPLLDKIWVREDSDSEDDEDCFGSVGHAEELEPIQLEKPRIDSAELRKAMLDFFAAMENSQKSQQDIHDWDRKMGLKRSHSKTMRLSSRSRKQLRAILKRQIG